MVNREDLVFATCNQLASAIIDDWVEIPTIIAEALHGLDDIDEPGDSLRSSVFSINPAFLNLTPSEAEPESLRKRRMLTEAKIAVELFSNVLRDSESWVSEDSDTYKKELRTRVSDYTDLITKITTPIPFVSHIKL